ncbi:unnamed protein product [Rotaria magnacalcarata]|uniref:Uncharacterized protein n=1 Tax=Rotaria magnacalcarata TaxID=392030 RepID=A0A816QXD1_9BILA|nr:unnamed protein product [Rotaria magnacalcarata]CAF3854569.1 unnamed protein product [Rotaria magnacalcarata]
MDSLIICDSSNGRVVRWSRRSGTNQGDVLIDKIVCSGLAMDDERFIYLFYLFDSFKYTVRRYGLGDKNGTIVTHGDGIDCLCVRLANHRVMKWVKNAKESIVVAEGNGNGTAMTQLYGPNGLFVDALGTVYVADSGNNRVMRRLQGAVPGTVLAYQNPAELSYPMGSSLD